ncbi:MAG TPA: hypothetical protein VFB16_11805 [Bauldia sp.]|nr:hypothetical protein [Bauldia sp.]
MERCPFPRGSSAQFEQWLAESLQCSAGKREFNLGRYFVARFRNGIDFAEAHSAFRREAALHRKTGFLAIFDNPAAAEAMTAAEELALLGAAVEEAGLTQDPEKLVAGETLATPVDMICPVTGKETTYEFFSVAFCRKAGDRSDPLYDPSLSAPFTAINTTSDAFALAMLVRDQAMRAWGKAPHEMDDREAVAFLLRKCVTVWQNMSINTIQNYNRVAADPARAVHLSEDRRTWIAPHNDPVFGELKKCPFSHEMPITYATRLTAKWLANLFEGKEVTPSRDGQSGGIPVFAVEGIPSELYEF